MTNIIEQTIIYLCLFSINKKSHGIGNHSVLGEGSTFDVRIPVNYIEKEVH